MKCKYCGRQAKIRYRSDGRKSGHNVTCGDVDCIKKRSDSPFGKGVFPYSNKNKLAMCEHCGKKFVKNSAINKWCKECAPNNKARRLLKRYNISAAIYQTMLDKSAGKCYICIIKVVDAVDHDHETEKIRGLVCNRCNMALSIIENPELLQRAISYLKV